MGFVPFLATFSYLKTHTFSGQNLKVSEGKTLHKSEDKVQKMSDGCKTRGTAELSTFPKELSLNKVLALNILCMLCSLDSCNYVFIHLFIQQTPEHIIYAKQYIYP